MESPMPRPSDFVVKNGSNICCTTAGSSPAPVSSTAMSALSGSATVEDIDGKSHAKAVRFRREERFEHMLHDGRIQPRAGVFDRNERAIWFCNRRGYRWKVPCQGRPISS